MRIAVGRLGAAAVDHQAGDLDPRHHHRGGGGGEGGGGGGGGGAQQQQQEADEQQHHHQRLLQLHHHEVHQQEQDPPVFQLQQLQAAAVRHRGLSEYALMGDTSHHQHHGGGFQPQLLSFGGAALGQHQLHQFTAQASHQSRSSRAAAGGGEIVPASASRGGVRTGAGGGEIVAVQGGHIVRSTGRKDRHSKVCTARGPRDRRVRLSAHTAIQFYDVQDRLGYDRPSKAVDWLIKNAKDAIDKLETLPAWHPTTNAASNTNAANPSSSTHPDDSADNSADDQAITVAHAGFDFPPGAGTGGGGGGTGGGGAGTGGFLPSSLDSDSIADTIKSFFPMGGTAGGDASPSTAAAQSSAMGAGGFQTYTPDLLSRTGSHHSQELRLSLQSSLSDPTMFHHHHQQDPDSRPHNGSAQQVLFPGYSFGGGGMWAAAEQHQRSMLPWGNMPDPGGGGGGYLFNVSQQQQQQHMLGAQSQQQFLFQRGPLQSSSNNQPSSDRGWPEATVEAADNPMFGFSGFRVPGRMQGDEDHNGGGGNGDKPQPPSSVTSASHH